MNKIIDFTNAEKGKFYKKNAIFEFPVYLNQNNYEYLSEIATKNKQDISLIINRLIENEIKNFDLVLNRS
ncbi:MAG: hypothetical protein WCR55_03900 [Lentisphaerota bacterium]